MANQYVNKVVVGGETKLDLTGDTVVAEKLAQGYKAHDKSGAPIVGTNTFDADTSDATAAAAEILNGKTAYVAGNKITGTMPNKGAVNGEIAAKAEQFTIPAGFHDGSGKVGISATAQAAIVAGNIKQGVTILGVEGTYGGEAVKAQANKNVTPTFAAQEILPDEGYDYLAKVTVAKIPVTETDNAAGGITVTVGA